MSNANPANQELPANWEDLAEEAEPLESSDDDELICPKCFTPIDPVAHMCCNCGGPVSGFALWDPISRIWGEGFGYRQITKVGSEPRLAHVLGVWIIFAPTLIGGACGILLLAAEFLDSQVGLSQRPEVLNGEPGILLKFLFSVIWVAVPIAIIRRVTINYQRSRRKAAEKESPV